VDDTPANLFAVRALLEPTGYEIVTAESGEKALACAAESAFALVLLDVMMPGMDGYETLKRLRGLPGFDSTPVLLVTAYEPLAQMIEQAYALGASDYVFKPIAPKVLIAKVGVFMALNNRDLELRRWGEALAAKDRQIAILAHDLRAPLTTIETVAESMARHDRSPRNQIQTERILRTARRMDAMTRDLLDFARIGDGGLPMARTETDLGQVVREAVEEIGAAHPERSIDIDVRGDLSGLWDAGRLQQALANLVVNAVQYGKGQIAVRAQRRGTDAELMVWNEGAPIPEARIDQIFEPFERGQAGGTGLGLGLYIVREIVRAHGGSVRVSSSPDQGTVFTLVLPTQASTEAHAGTW
jgi:signal transduction histidine kinase